jgi:general stress protein 26/ketosteroid isomerase-like protein
MTDSIENEIVAVIQSINRTCVKGAGFDELADSLADDFTTYPPGFSRCAKGKQVNLQMYKDFCSQANIKKMDESDWHVDIFGDTAVVNYRYESQWEFNGTRFDENGREVVVLKNNQGRWQIVWRTLIIGNRKTDGAISVPPADTGSAADIRSQCLALMANSPSCELTTIDADGFPHTTAMNNLRDKTLYPDIADLFKGQNNDFIIYMSTANQSGKMARMLANPKVSVYFCDAPRFHGLMLGGEIEIVTDQQLKNKIWQKGWTVYYPNGPQGPEYGVIKLTPTLAKGWSCTGEYELTLSGE